MTPTKYITIPRKGMQTFMVKYVEGGMLKSIDVSAYSLGGVDAEFRRLTGLSKTAIEKQIKKNIMPCTNQT